VIDTPPLTDPANTEHDAAIMRDMLGHMRVFARGWAESPPAGPNVLVREVELAPRHYHSARLHNGIVRLPLLGDADLVVLRTRFYDFDGSRA
jgi:hypothetical protein